MAGTETTSGVVWLTWCASTTTAACDADTTWSQWTVADCTDTSATSTSSDAVWYSWTETPTGTVIVNSGSSNRQHIESETERRRREAKARRKQREKRRARKRAWKLLTGELTPDQLRDFARNKRFNVVGQSGKQYRIDCRGLIGNVYRLNAAGKPDKRFCAHPRGSIPLEDALLGQKLALEANESEFLRVANVHALNIHE